MTQSLITRLREAEGADLTPRLWEEICTSLNVPYATVLPHAHHGASLDAALALVAEVLKDQSPSVNLNINSVNNHATIAAFTETNWRKSDHNGWHKSPAIALLIALLQAQGVQDG